MKVNPVLSPEDHDLADPRWYISGNGKYPTRTTRNSKTGKEYLHRLVLARKLGRNLQKGELADHINHNPMDCRRENLRITNAAGNSQNRKPHSMWGVTFHKATGKWQAQVQAESIPIKERFLGLFDTPEQAAQAASERRKQLNFLSDYEPEQHQPGSGSHHDIREHLQHGGTREDYGDR